MIYFSSMGNCASSGTRPVRAAVSSRPEGRLQLAAGRGARGHVKRLPVPGLSEGSGRHRTPDGRRQRFQPREPDPRTMSLHAHELIRRTGDGSDSAAPPGVRTERSRSGRRTSPRASTAHGGRFVADDLCFRWKVTPLFPWERFARQGLAFISFISREGEDRIAAAAARAAAC